MLKKEELNKIGYSYIIDQIDTKTAKGRSFINRLTLKTNEELQNDYKILNGLKKYFNNDYSQINIYLAKLNDISKIVSSIKGEETLTLVEIFEVKKQLILYEKINSILKGINIPFPPLFSVEEPLLYLNDSDNITEDFMIYEKYSKELFKLRSLRSSYEKKYLLSKNEEEKSKLLKVRNDITKEELILEESVRTNITKYLLTYVKKIGHNMAITGLLDSYIAKNRLALKYNCVLPEFNKSSIEFTKLSNPYLRELVESANSSYTFIDIKLDERVTLLTGANMGGKSSIIDALLLNTLLARTGFYIFAEKGNVPYIDAIYYLYSKGANSLHGLSSFGNELITLNSILNSCTTNSLIAVDEFAQTTNPTEGRLFVKALIKLLQTKSQFSLVSTHYDNVSNAIKHYQIKGLKENVVDFDLNINNFMDYSLAVTTKQSTPKQAIKIAEILLNNNELLTILKNSIKED